MDMNKAFYLRKEDFVPRWLLVDAAGERVGRLATRIADKLRGRNSADYTPHVDSGNYVVVINVAKIEFTGAKMTNKEYVWYTGWMGGQKRVTPKKLMEKYPERILCHAVKGMLPKNKMARQQIRKLKIYAGDKHPHAAQIIGFAPAKK